MILILISSLWFNFYPVQNVNLSLALEIPDCIDLERNNKMTFVFTNNSKKDIDIFTSYLVIDKVLNQEGEKIIPNKRIHHHIPSNVPKCVSIPASASKKITVDVNYFSAYDIPRGQKAQVIGMYQTSYFSKKQRQGLEDLYTYPTVFTICEEK